MGSAKRRLEAGVALLALIDRRREETHDQGLGSALEMFVINRELRELEREFSRPAGGPAPADASA